MLTPDVVEGARHTCSAWCRDGVHAGICWADVDQAQVEPLARQHYSQRGWDLVSFTPAPEAPARDPAYPAGPEYPFRFLVLLRRLSGVAERPSCDHSVTIDPPGGSE